MSGIAMILMEHSWGRVLSCETRDLEFKSQPPALYFRRLQLVWLAWQCIRPRMLPPSGFSFKTAITGTIVGNWRLLHYITRKPLKLKLLVGSHMYEMVLLVIANERIYHWLTGTPFYSVLLESLPLPILVPVINKAISKCTYCYISDKSFNLR